MGESSLCIFIKQHCGMENITFKPLIVGTIGFRLMYFYLLSLIIWHSLILPLRSIWNSCVRSFLALVKLLLDMKFVAFLCYSSWYIIIMELHLSAFDTTALLLLVFLWFHLWLFFSFFMCIVLRVCWSTCCLYNCFMLCANW